MSKKSSQKETIKTTVLDNESHVGVISGESRVLWNPSGATPVDFIKSNRSDYGRVVDIRRKHGYHGQLSQMAEIKTDTIVGYLLNRTVHFAVNGMEWELALKKHTNFLEQLKNKISKVSSQEEKEQTFWNTFSARINTGVPNVMPGIDEIIKWSVSNLMSNGMVVIEWEWGRMNINGVDYDVPLKMTVHNPSSILLERSAQGFVDERMYLKLSSSNSKISETNLSSPIGMGTQNTKNPKDWHEITIMGTARKPKLEGFAMKYNWTPADNTVMTYGSNVSVGQGLYPTPPFVGLYEAYLTRRALAAADIAILDGVINFILDWEIGDATKISNNGRESLPNQPRPAKYDASGTKTEKSIIEMAKEIITSDTRGNVMQLFHPYYMKLNIKMPDTTVLLNTEKWIQSTVEIYQAFGILLSPKDGRMDFTGINVQNFEEMLENIRQMHIRRFWEALASEIVDRNKDKLTAVPNMIFKPLNTKTEAFREGLWNLMKIGKISTKSLLQANNLDSNVEIQRIAQEIGSGEKELTDRQVPVSYVQSAKKQPGDKNSNTNNDGTIIESKITPLQQAGRPTKGNEKKGKK